MNLSKLGKKGTSFTTLLKNDYDKWKEDLNSYKSKLEEVKLQLHQNEALKSKEEDGLKAFKEKVDLLKADVKGIIPYIYTL